MRVEVGDVVVMGVGNKDSVAIKADRHYFVGTEQH